MKMNFKEAMNTLFKMETVFREMTTFEKYKNIPRHSIFMIWSLKYKYSGKVSSKEIIEKILSKHPKITKGTLEVKISKMIKKGKDMGMVKKVVDAKDNRIKYFALTNKGEKWAAEINNDAMKLWGETND